MTTRIAVLEKSFLVLETMSELGRAATLKELAEASGLPKPTLFRILQTMVELGYVDQDHVRSRYALTMRLFHLGRADSYEDVRRRALPFMEVLHARFDETVNLGILEGTSVSYVHFIETTQNLRWQVRPGTQDPFYCTALGRAIVSHLPAKRRQQLLDRITVTQRTPRSPATRAEVEARLDEARANGWARDDEENDLGVVCFGVPLLDDGEPIASISLSVPKTRLTPELEAAIAAALLEVRAGRLPEMPLRRASA